MESLKRYLRSLVAVVSRQTGIKPHAIAPKFNGGQQRGSLSHSQILALPEAPLKPIQDMTPGSPTFGEFLYLMGFDGLGTAPLGGG